MSIAFRVLVGLALACPVIFGVQDVYTSPQEWGDLNLAGGFLYKPMWPPSPTEGLNTTDPSNETMANDTQADGGGMLLDGFRQEGLDLDLETTPAPMTMTLMINELIEMLTMVRPTKPPTNGRRRKVTENRLRKRGLLWVAASAVRRHLDPFLMSAKRHLDEMKANYRRNMLALRRRRRRQKREEEGGERQFIAADGTLVENILINRDPILYAFQSLNIRVDEPETATFGLDVSEYVLSALQQFVISPLAAITPPEITSLLFQAKNLYRRTGDPDSAIYVPHTAAGNLIINRAIVALLESLFNFSGVSAADDNAENKTTTTTSNATDTVQPKVEQKESPIANTTTATNSDQELPMEEDGDQEEHNQLQSEPPTTWSAMAAHILTALIDYVLDTYGEEVVHPDGSVSVYIGDTPPDPISSNTNP